MTDNIHNGNNDTNGGNGRGSFRAFFVQLAAGIRRLVREGNRRHLVMRSERGQTLLRLPLTVAVIILLVIAWTRLLPILVIAVIVALVMRVKFALQIENTPS